jgi:hypothetical protein
MIAGGAWAGVGCVCAGGFGSQTLSDKRSRGGSCIRERVSGVSVLDAPNLYRKLSQKSNPDPPPPLFHTFLVA